MFNPYRFAFLAFSLLLLAVTTSSCYRPGISDGGFRCADLPAKRCPDGFSCDPIGLRCVKVVTARDGAVPDVITIVDTGAGGRDATAVMDSAMDVGVTVDMAVDRGVACVGPKAGCTADVQNRRCDPMCQAGCPCRERCSVNTGGTLTCNVPGVGTRRQLGQSCDIVLPGLASQNDNCEAGLVCLNDSCGGGRCYQFCRVDTDCTNSTCTRDAGGGNKICDVPFFMCNPVGGTAQSGCPSTAQGCYLTTTGDDRTLCDCPFDSVRENGACTLSRDCLPGLVCVDPTNSTNFRCRRVCQLGGPGNVCNGGSCRALNGSRLYGYCN